jgi:hypothetical protein
MESYCSLCTFKVPQGANNLIVNKPGTENITIYQLRIGECPSNSPFLKNNGAEAHCF